jgi:hypothetical protein
MSADRRWTIAIRPVAGEAPYKITKIIGLNGDGFSVLVPYHSAKSGFIFKHPMDLQTLGSREIPWDQAVGFTAEDRVKLSYHIDGFAQFSSENPGPIISGRDAKTGEPKAMGLLTRTLLSPPTSGPSVGVQVWGIEEFEKADQEKELIVFESQDFYYRRATPDSANTWHLAIYAFPVRAVPPVRFRNGQPIMLYQPHAITAGIPGAIIELKTIFLREENLYLGLYVERFEITAPVKSGWWLNGPGNYNQYQSGRRAVSSLFR